MYNTAMIPRVAGLLLLPLAHAFVPPMAFPVTKESTTSVHVLPPFDVTSSLTLADDFDQVAAATMSGGDSIMDTVGTVLTFLVGGAFFLFGLTFVMASVIIPAAARQLEQQTKEMDLALWNEYQAKLGPGETIDMRPDLMQELGNKVQAMQYERMTREANDQAKENEDFLETLDAEIVSKETKSANDDA